jgi:oligopeptide transport system substrate-binding protein
MNDLDLRQALSLALDRRRLAADVFGPSAQPATGFEPPALAITTGTTLDSKTGKGAPLSRCGSSPLGPDVVSARRHLAAATKSLGADKLRDLTLTVNTDIPYPQLAKAVTAQWRATLGLSVKVVTRPWNDYLSAANGSTGLASMFRIRWASDLTAPTVTFNDQQVYLSTLLSSDATSNGNWEHWSDRTFDYGLSVDAARLTDVQQRGIAFGKLADIACQQLPLLPLVFQRPTYLVRSTTVGSARPVSVGRDGLLLLRELYIK